MENDVFEKFAPAGHFYSPLPDITEVRNKEKALFDRTKKELPGISINEEKQVELLYELGKYYPEIPFSDKKQSGLRYYYGNGAYDHGDAIILHSMIRHFKPARIIEVGSGYSSAVMLDTNQLFFNDKIDCTFIEPYTQVLESIMQDKDRQNNIIIKDKVQNIDITLFDQLEAGDICFIDSTHVAKIGSDVNFLIFEILPRLKSGVIVHIHDIFYPFEYPSEWIYSGRAWNEIYILRAFLEFNNKFEIILFNHFLGQFYREKFINTIPDFFVNPGGSLWLRVKN